MERKKTGLRSLTPSQCSNVIQRINSKESMSALAHEYQVSVKTIKRIYEKRENDVNSLNIGTPSEASTRKRQKNLDMKTKEEVIKDLDNGKKITDLATKYDVSEMTIRRIQKNKDELLTHIATLKENDWKEKSLEKKVIIKESKLDEALYAWFTQMRDIGQPVSGDVLREKALLLNKELHGEESFCASKGWLYGFQQRYGIHQVSMQGEKLSADEAAASKFSVTFNRFLQENSYDLDQVYNADESGLYWKALPKRTLISGTEKGAAGHKDNKERVTVLFCANATGTHKIPLLIIGKSMKPRCFKNVRMESLPITYTAQKSAWMTKDIFMKWYKTVFLPEIVRKHPHSSVRPRKVLLVLDNAPSHPPALELNAVDETCQIMYLPPNATALMQPMDQGVIEKTKRLYKNYLLRELYLEKDQANLFALVKKLTIKDCCYKISRAWDLVTEQNLRNAWNKLLKNENWEENPEAYHRDVLELLGLIQKLSGFETCSYEQAKSWIEADFKECGWQIFSAEEILQRIENRNTYQQDCDDDWDGEDSEISDMEESVSDIEQPAQTLQQALQGLDQFQNWFETRWECDKEDLSLLQTLRYKALYTS